ncbi:hypothetical protein [Litoribacter populi]|uniref:hypothetical protein n=1 Tax=Litoribacter populi TaxID=2598460 RepID=UPI00117D939B|nr:hypothetical protein [Litoribacter populi]
MKEKVLIAVCLEYDIKESELLGFTKKKPFSEARQMFYLFLSKEYRHWEIADFTRRDRSNVTKQISQIRQHVKIYKEVSQRYQNIKNHLEKYELQTK